MSLTKIVTEQYKRKVDDAFAQFHDTPATPAEGWIRTVRKAIGMTGEQLADRLGVTKARIYRLERGEPNGSVTLKSMQNTAAAMNCRFIYAVIPEQEVDHLIRAQAKRLAEARVKAASTQMALELQALSRAELKAEVERIAKQIEDELPADLWDKQ